MNKSIYISNPWVYWALIGFFSAGGLLLIALGEYLPSIAGFGLAIFVVIPVLVWRKTLFSKILVDDKGIRVSYKQEVRKQVLWSEIQDALAIPTGFNGQIVFAKDKGILATQKQRLENWKELFFIRLSSTEPANALYQHKDKLTVLIRDLDKLSKTIREKLQKN